MISISAKTRGGGEEVDCSCYELKTESKQGDSDESPFSAAGWLLFVCNPQYSMSVMLVETT